VVSALVGGACLSTAFSAWAVQEGVVPDAGALMRGTEQLQNFNAPLPELPTKPKREMRSKEGQQSFVVKRFRITGATLVPSGEIQYALEPWLDVEITFADLEDALQAITDLYQKHGWYARPQLPEQDLVDGVVTIQIIEGKLGEVKVDESAGARISGNRIVNTITARQDLGAPLNLKAMERAISILNDTPGISVNTAMAPGTTPETTDLIVKVEPKRWWGLNSSIDNFGARSTGYGRISVNGNADNPLGIGDQITVNYVGSLGTQFGRIGYTLPIGYDGLRFGVNYSALGYHTIDSFGYPVKQFGTAQIGELLATYPLLRSATGNINTALTFDKKRYYNASQNISGAPLADVNATNAQPGVIVQIGDKWLNVGTWALNGDHYDSLLGGGAFYWGSNLTTGYLDLTSSPAVAVATDQNGLNAAGNYTKYTGNLSRLQRVTDTTQLWMSWQGQLASKNLDSSEDFSLGGPQGVRAYPNYEAQGDQGWLGTLEGRRTFGDSWQGTAFFDAGRIKVNRFTWTNSYSPNMYNLYGAGIGVNYTLPGKMVGKMMVAHRIGSNPGANPTNGSDNDGTHLPWRFWLSLSGTL
jgi:hemolysin activation/secretion protein